MREYPWNVHAKRIDSGASKAEAYVAAWRYFIAVQLASTAIDCSSSDVTEAQKLSQFLAENYGSVNPDLSTILRPKTLRVSKRTIEPQILGNKLGSISLEASDSNTNFGIELDALTNAIIADVITLTATMHVERLSLHFDELDYGLIGLDTDRNSMLIGLILASRSIRMSCRSAACMISPVVYLRSDIWEEMSFSDKNKITNNSAVDLEWNDVELKKLVNARLNTYLGLQWDDIANPKLMRGSQKKWNHILSRSFLRPRDIIQFLNCSLKEAKGRPDSNLVFENEDIVAARNSYSVYLKKELDDEILAHWPHWEDALQACSAISTLTFSKDQFVAEYNLKRSKENDKEPEEALKSLFSFSVVSYDRRSGYGGSLWVSQYTNPEVGWDPSATRFKVHLGLKEYAKLSEERK